MQIRSLHVCWGHSPSRQSDGLTPVSSDAGERNVPLASEGVTEEHVGYGLEHREDQGGRGHVSTTRE